MNDNTISNDTCGLLIEDTRGEKMKLVLGISNDNGMTRVRTACDTCANIILLVEGAKSHVTKTQKKSSQNKRFCGECQELGYKRIDFTLRHEVIT